jgi:hypothetical protein
MSVDFSAKTLNPYFSPSRLWNTLRSDLLHATRDSQHSPPVLWDTKMAHLWEYFNQDRLHHSQLHPARSTSVRGILQILHDFPTTGRPLEIYVMGGSVTAGMDCAWQHAGIAPRETYLGTDFACAWPSRLEWLLNAGVLRHYSPTTNNSSATTKKPVRVTNWANSGYSSDVSAFMLRHRLYTQGHSDVGPPHIIIWSHAPNDGWGIYSAQILEYQERFVEAAYRTHAQQQCSEHHYDHSQKKITTPNTFPLIIMLHDMHGMTPQEFMHTNNNIDRVATWYQLMSISYGHAVFSTLLGHVYKVAQDLFGGNFHVHMGLQFHMGVALVVAYNLVHAMSTVCQWDYEAAEAKEEAMTVASIPFIPESSNATSTVNAFEMDITNSLNAIEDLPLGLLPRPGINSTPFVETAKRWRANVYRSQQTCASQPQNDGGNNSTTTVADLHDNPCEYKWIKRGHEYYTSGDPAIDLKDVTLFLEPYLVDNQGWSYECNLTSHIQPGWYAHEEQAWFTLQFHPVSVPVQHLTLLHAKSYNGTPFTDAVLNLTTTVISRTTTTTTTPSQPPNESTTVIASNDTHTMRSTSALIPVIIPTHVTVPFIYRHALPEGGALPGDTVQLHFALVSGHRFMIIGMALCLYD